MTKNPTRFFGKNEILYKKSKIPVLNLSLILTVGHQRTEKTFDKHLAVLVGAAADTVHLPADLFKVVQGAGVFGKNLVGVILQPQVGQVDKAGAGRPADALLHRFGVLAELPAQFP